MHLSPLAIQCNTLMLCYASLVKLRVEYINPWHNNFKVVVLGCLAPNENTGQKEGSHKGTEKKYTHGHHYVQVEEGGDTVRKLMEMPHGCAL